MPIPIRGAGPSPQTACWTPERSELRTWLRRNAVPLADLYEGAVLLLFEVHVPGGPRFIAHAVREIRNRLPDAVSGTRTPGNLNYKDQLDNIVKRWKKAGFPIDGRIGSFPVIQNSSGSQVAEIPLPRDIVSLVAKLIADHEETRIKPEEAATRLFVGAAPENERFRDALRPAITQWLDITGWFMKQTHDPGTGVSIEASVDRGELQTKFSLFETTLLSIVRGFSTFFETTDALDEILEDTNS